MILVETYLRDSDIHGIGVFSRNFIPKGEVIWRQGYEREWTESEFNLLPNSIQEIILTRGWRDVNDEIYRLSIDNDQFMNHSSSANIETLADGTQVASRDIWPGEELTNNYAEFDLRAEEKFK